MAENIKVAIRVRPFLPGEAPIGCVRATENQVMVGDGRCFAFDTVFNMAATSDDVYVALGQPLANSFLDGFNVSTIAYGQTGAGKTFTMSALTNDVVQEIFCRLQEDALQAEERQGSDLGFTLRVSALEVYNEHVGDLLHNKASAVRHIPGVQPVATAAGERSSPVPSPCNGAGVSSPVHRTRKQSLASGNLSNGPNGGMGPSLALREDPKGGVYVAGLSEYEVRSEEALLACIDAATANRKTATTLMNATSSRSHCVVTLTLHRKGVMSRCCFVDLAGSERFKKSLGVGLGPSAATSLHNKNNTNNAHHSGSNNSSLTHPGDNGSLAENPFMGGDATAGSVVMERMREGISINGGLLALGNVIVALCEKKAHVPYRSSKLTRLLQPMLGGNSRTAMVACISPLESSIEETLNTLKYANRAKAIKTNPHLVASVSTLLMSPEEAERIILALRKELEDVQQQLASALHSNPAPTAAHSAHGNVNHLRTNSQGPRTTSLGARGRQRSGSIPAVDLNTVSSPSARANQARGRKRTTSRQALPRSGAMAMTGSPATPPAPAPPSAGSAGAVPTAKTMSTAETAALLRQVSELKLQLAQERAVTKRLEEDLFNAEYTTMIEVEKRRAAEERVLELESMMTPNDEGSTSSCAPSNNSPSDSPRTRLTQNMVLLRKLEEERDSLQKLKALREDDKMRLSAAISGGTSTVTEDRASPFEENEDAAANDAALAELTADIEAKNEQVAALVRQNDGITQQLREYERELELIGGEKARLQEELAKAEELLERSEMDRQHKDRERARLQAEYRERLRKAEERAADYRRRVKRAEQDVKMRSLNLQRIDLLKGEVDKLREEAAKHKAGRRAEQKKGAQADAAHTQEVTHLQKQLSRAEQQVARLQGNLQRKEAEIARIRAKVLPSGAAAGGGGAANGKSHGPPHPLSNSGVILKQPPPHIVAAHHHHHVHPNQNTRSTHPNSNTNRISGGNATAPAETPSLSVHNTNTEIQAQIDEEVAKLGRLEKELEDLQNCRRVLAQTQSTDAPKYQTALKGFTKRLQRIDEQLNSAAGKENQGDDSVISVEDHALLEAEREDIEAKLRQLEAFQKMFDEAEQQLEEFDDRIDSLNETRKYHLHRVRRLQHARTDSTTTSLAGETGARTPLYSELSHTAAPYSTISAFDEGGSLTRATSASLWGNDSVGPLPSVREITTARRRNAGRAAGGSRRQPPRYQDVGEFLEAVPSPISGNRAPGKTGSARGPHTVTAASPQ